ncbi:hypothetical protein [Clostridium sp. YIM B02555]|uniref:hypothetical protein n=1 Tax=Clostridium sp. YIM B02555 TaxID=2911968 RepID=UPI001EEF3E4A|nr:hypothetical protein [Clostridium sp. YIM B02555]
MKKRIIGCILLGLMVCSSSTAAFAGTWVYDKYESKWSYLKDNGKYAKDEWIYDNGSWYFIVWDTYMVSSGPVIAAHYNNTGGGDYCFDASGKLSSGGFIYGVDGTKMYFSDKQGHAIKGLFMVDGNLYFANKDNDFIDISRTAPEYLLIHNSIYDKYDGRLNSGYADSYTIRAQVVNGKILNKDGKPFLANDKIFTQIKYLPKYDSQGNLIGEIKNPNGYDIE